MKPKLFDVSHRILGQRGQLSLSGPMVLWELAACNKESTANADQIVTILLRLEFVRDDLLVIIAWQETGSWDTEKMHFPGFVLCGQKSTLTMKLVSGRLCDVQRTWWSEERWKAVLFGFTMVMSMRS